MRLYDFAHGIVSKFAPIPPTDASDLNQESVKTYATLKKEAEEIKFHNDLELEKAKVNADYKPNIKPVVFKYKIMLLLETWYMRYLVAFVYIFVLRRIQIWLTRIEMEGEPEDEDEDISYEDFLEFKRLQKSKR